MSDGSVTPIVSVIIPTYNRAQKVQAAIRSVLSQTYPDYEIILVDDGSTDGTAEAVERFFSQEQGNVKKVRYLFQHNQGPSISRNTGIEHARGKWIAFLDSDDLWFPEKLECQLQVLEQFKEAGACVADAQMVNDVGLDASTFHQCGRVYHQPIGIASDALLGTAKDFPGFWLSTLLVRTDLARDLKGFDPDIQVAEDRDFHFRLALKTRFAYINKLLVRTDRSASMPGSNCRPWDKWHIRLRGHQRMYEKWLASPALPVEIRKIISVNLRCTHSHWTNWYLAHEQFHNARESASNALRYGFTFSLALKWILTRFMPGIARKMTLNAGSDNAVYSR